MSARIGIVGDVMGHLGTSIAEAEGQPFGAQLSPGLWQFAAEHDELWGNLEGPMRAEPDGVALHMLAWTSSASPWPKLYLTRRQAEVLAALGFRVLGVANNHAFDFGGAGDAASSAEALRQTGIDAPGVDLTPVVREVGGVSIAVLAVTTMLNVPRPLGPVALLTPRTAERVRAAVSSARRAVDHVVVFVHWGQEYGFGPTAAERAIADELLAAGASLVVGSHPHVLWPIEPGPHGSLVCWSLGNFLAVFACPSTDPAYGRLRRALWSAVLSVEFDRRRLRAVVQPIAVEHSLDAWHDGLGRPGSYLGWGPVELAAWRASPVGWRPALRSQVVVHGPARAVPLDAAAATALDPWRGEPPSARWTTALLTGSR